MSNKPFFMIGAVAALVGVPFAIMYMDKFNKRMADPDRSMKAGSTLSGEVKDDVKHRGAEASRKFQHKASEVKGAVTKEAQEIGHEADEARKHAVETGSSWLKWGANKANEAGDQAEHTLERTEEEAKNKTSELKSGFMHAVEETAKIGAHGWFDWGDEAEDVQEKIKIKEKVNTEHGKGKTVMTDKKAQEAKDARAKGSV